MKLKSGDLIKTNYGSKIYIITRISRGCTGYYTSGKYTGKSPGYPLPMHMNITCKEHNGTNTEFYLSRYDEKTLKSVTPECSDYLIPLETKAVGKEMRNELVPAKNRFSELLTLDQENDFLKLWIDMYFEIEVTTQKSSQEVQERDLNLLVRFLIEATGSDHRLSWTPRISGEFKTYLRSVINPSGKRRWSDRTINRIIAHIKTFAKWINKIAPFPLGNPMAKIKALPVGNSLEIERAITPPERRRILDAADLLISIGSNEGRSKDRVRYKDVENRPARKGYRPYRNRAILYTLIETGMRRAAVTSINLDGVDTDLKKIIVEEKGGVQRTYNISTEGINAIRDYIINERDQDADHWQSPALFLVAKTIKNSSGRLNARSINNIWNDVCKNLNINKSPHCARHAMGRYIMDKTGNLAAVQRQLGHKNATYSMQYARITDKELNNVLDER